MKWKKRDGLKAAGARTGFPAVRELKDTSTGNQR
jgi:hypothetical protein